MDALLARTLHRRHRGGDDRSAYSDLQMYIAEHLPFLGLVFRTGSVLSTRSLAGLTATREMDVYNGLGIRRAVTPPFHDLDGTVKLFQKYYKSTSDIYI